MRYIVSCSITSLPRLAFFFGAPTQKSNNKKTNKKNTVDPPARKTRKCNGYKLVTKTRETHYIPPTPKKQQQNNNNSSKKTLCITLQNYKEKNNRKTKQSLCNKHKKNTLSISLQKRQETLGISL